MSESALMSIQGVGKTLCARLIKEFGSVEEIRLKTPEEIAKADGVSLSLAERIIRALNNGENKTEDANEDVKEDGKDDSKLASAVESQVDS